ncbi:MAG: iron-containing alcohol dehydrogenase [Planctomycetes bacterium]|nr:iron-containing alcohol dehydrogenase [Planctomycetota bacterium]
MMPFPENPRPHVVFGPDTVEQIGSLARSLNTHRALLVTDPHIYEAGHAPRAIRSLEQAGLAVTVFDRVRENPTTEDVDACLDVALKANADVIVGIGGGSSMDTAKGCNFILTNGGRMADYWGVDKATQSMLPFIAVPTTGGTGSECQSFALIADPMTHQKMACGDKKAAASIAILDPTLTTTQPRHVTANTGVDALTHAVETAVTLKRNDLSLRYAREAFKLIAANLARVLDEPNDIAARGQMLLAAAYAGTAIEHSMLGAAHAAANPLTAQFHVVHGQAVGLMLPSVVRYNAEDAEARAMYEALAAHAGLEPTVEALLTCIESLLDAAKMPRVLEDVNVPRDAIGALAADAASQWTAQFNPRPIDADGFVGLYEATFSSQSPTA